jgi:hypothetical protein
MVQVSLDTSFLISFADPGRANHAVAVDYFRHCLAQQIPMWLSTVAAGEFEVGQPVSDLPLQNFRIQPYNLPHAIRAAAFFRALRQDDAKPVDIAQAAEENIAVILTEDRNTLSKLAERLRAAGQSEVRVLLLTEGFTPGRLETPAQGEFPLPVPLA